MAGFPNASFVVCICLASKITPRRSRAHLCRLWGVSTFFVAMLWLRCVDNQLLTCWDILGTGVAMIA